MKKIVMNYRTKMAVIVIVMLIVTLSILTALHMTGEYDEIGSVIRKTQKNFGISNIDYKEILCSKLFKAGPLGEGDGLIVIQLTDESARDFILYAEKNLLQFPMSNVVEYFTYEMHDEKCISEHLKALERGFYGFYSYTDRGIIKGNKLIKAAEYGTYSLSGYLYIQYDTETGILYIWDHS